MSRETLRLEGTMTPVEADLYEIALDVMKEWEFDSQQGWALDVKLYNALWLVYRSLHGVLERMEKRGGFHRE